MKETQHILKLFEAGYNGHPWIDVNLVDTLQTISAAQALKKISSSSNSIWEITNHIISWRKNVLQRVNGKVIQTPSHNYFVAVKNGTDAEWKTTLKELELTQTDWINFLKTMEAPVLEQVYEPNHMTYYEHIQGILQHDAYHLGQIVMLTKLLNDN